MTILNFIFKKLNKLQMEWIKEIYIWEFHNSAFESQK